MGSININGFLGAMPRVGRRLLNDANSTKAVGCDVRSGELRPFNKSKLVEATGKYNWKTLYRWYNAGDEPHWLIFPSEVNVVESPVVDDVWRRIYWTGDSRFDAPRMSYAGAIESGSTMPATSYKVGLPQPSDQIVVSPEERIVMDIEEVLHERPVKIKTIGSHKLETGESVEFDIEAESEGTGESKNDLAKLLNPTKFTITVTSDDSFTLDFSDAFNVEYTNFISGKVMQYFNPAYKEATSYRFTYVNNLGEEGPPSNPSTTVDIGRTQKVHLELPILSPSDGEGRIIEKRRIYRSATGSSTAGYLFVDEVPISQSSYDDDKKTSDLVGSLRSTEYDPPNDKLRGLHIVAQGFGVGHFDNVVAFSEYNMLHAWPTSYHIAVETEVVAVQPTDSGIVVATKGKPYIIHGADPMSMQANMLENNYACVSARSMASLGFGAMYATAEGLVYISGGSAQLVTEGLLTESDWAEYAPETIQGYAHQNQYIGFYRKGAKRGAFIFNPRAPGAGLIELDFHALDAFIDPRERFLYWLDSAGDIHRWNDPDGVKQEYIWRSKDFASLRLSNLGYGKVSADNYPLTIRVYADDVLRYETEVVSEDVFPLPSKFLARVWSIELAGTANIKSASFGESYEEIE